MSTRQQAIIYLNQRWLDYSISFQFLSDVVIPFWLQIFWKHKSQLSMAIYSYRCVACQESNSFIYKLKYQRQHITLHKIQLCFWTEEQQLFSLYRSRYRAQFYILSQSYAFSWYIYLTLPMLSSVALHSHAMASGFTGTKRPKLIIQYIPWIMLIVYICCGE